MTERPILMSGPMVCATLRDWQPKTQSRRVIFTDDPHDHAPWWCRDHWQDGDDLLRCRYGQPGDRLWVRETWQINHIDYDRAPIPKARPLDRGEPVDLIYRADGEFADQFEIDEGGSCWRPSIFMPRWASRLSLDLLSVRVERLQAISEADAKAEGVERGWYERDTLDGAEIVPTTYVAGFRAAWDAMHGKRGYGWDVSPWVWVLEFRRVETHGTA